MGLTNEEIDVWRWAVGEVTPGLFVSGDLPHDRAGADEHLRRWVDAGVTHVLDVREEWSDEDLVGELAPQLGYTHLGTHDDGGSQSLEWFDAGVRAARKAMSAPDPGLLVHCHMGINRGPSMAFAVLLDLGWEIEPALDAISMSRPIAAIAYAEDAVRWHVRRHRGGDTMADVNALEVARWQQQHGIDVARVIRRIRRAEDGRAA